MISIVIPSCDQARAINSAKEIRTCCDELIFLDGTGYESFSKLINDSIDKAKHETVIICSDRCKPSPNDVTDLLNLLDQGYGLVGLYRFGFFGFRKYLISKIDYFDEQFIGGQYEDSDILYRMKEADIAYYDAEQVVYESGPSRWPAERVHPNEMYFRSKWVTTESTVQRILQNPKTTRQVPDMAPVKFLSWDKSVLLPSSHWFKDIKFVK